MTIASFHQQVLIDNSNPLARALGALRQAEPLREQLPKARFFMWFVWPEFGP